MSRIVQVNAKIRQKGLALVLVLWVLSLLTIMAGSFALSMRRQSAIISGVKNNAQAIAVAESGIAIAEMMLLTPDKEKVWRIDGGIYEIDYPDATVRIRLLSETGKIDINKAEQAQLEQLLLEAPFENERNAEDQATRITNAILDWRDEDDVVHLEGAEKKEYKDAGLKYQPRNKPFQTIEELQLVLGMDAALFKWIEPLITVYSGQSQVSFQHAPKEVLRMIPGLDAGLIDSYIKARQESAINGLPLPPSPFGSVKSSPAGQNTVISIVSEALLDNGSSSIISALIKKSNGAEPVPLSAPFQVLKWQRNAAGSASLFTDAMNGLLIKQYAGPEFNN